MSTKPVETDDEIIQSWGRVLSSDPSLRKYYALVIQHARAAGGLTLRTWQSYLGAVFAAHPDYHHIGVKPTEARTVEDVAAELGVPVSDVARVLHDTATAVQPQWVASQEYKDEQKLLAAHKLSHDERRRRMPNPPSEPTSR